MVQKAEATMTSPEYDSIRRHYGERRSRRFGLPLMNHINEGLRILAHIGASALELRAWCLHPLVQDDLDLRDTLSDPARIAGSDPRALLLAMEYRRVANASLSRQGIRLPDEIPLSPIPSVNTMLVADKIQNRKDFLLHAGHHFDQERMDELRRYFQCWIVRLGLSAERCVELTDVAVKGDLEAALSAMAI